MRPIQRIYVSCCSRDYHLARICVASIRYWHPGIPISVVKDYTVGPFDTREMEELWNVDVLELPRKKFGWPFIKLEPFFLRTGERIFGIDADIVFVGPLLDRLNRFDEDFVVHGSKRPATEIESHYYRLGPVRARLDPSFSYPGYIFNCGHIVGVAGLLTREDFEPLVSWDGTFPQLRHPDIFSHADQGIMNYVIHAKQGRGEISVASDPFSIWADNPEMAAVDLDKIRSRTPAYARLIHYAGSKPLDIARMQRPDLLSFFEAFYYSRLSGGRLRRKLRNGGRVAYFASVDYVKSIVPRRWVDAVKQRI
jgi:hypothetical protein